MTPKRNEYRCAVEINQNGKYCVRIRAHFGRHHWTLSAYFLASSFDRAMKKLGQVLQVLQQEEEKLWFWCVDHSDDPTLTGEMLQELGLHLDRRAEFPRRTAQLALSSGRAVAAFQLAPLRRALTESLGHPRAAVASD